MSWTTKDPAAPVWRLVVTDETASFGLTPAALKGSARQFVELLSGPEPEGTDWILWGTGETKLDQLATSRRRPCSVDRFQ